MATFRFENGNRTGKRTIPCVHLLDNYMSFRAKGLLSLLYAIGEDMEITAGLLTKTATDSRGMVMAALKELQLLGYIKRIVIRDEYGRFAGVEYYVSDQPIKRTPECIHSGRDGGNGSFQG